MADARQKNRNDPIICSCNNVRRSEIMAAIEGGARSMAGIFDATFAGCGPCGGTCQPEITAILGGELARRGQIRGK
jgi:NAD(P)H-nitrite reductase large subunit